jgi:5-methylcytosine-specific restriction endonuclease McrA
MSSDTNFWDHPEDEDDLALLDAESAYKTPWYDRYRWLHDMPYSQYLQSEHWQFTRRRALLRAGFQCQLCESGEQLNVHHLTYERRGREKEADIIVLCYACHGFIHANPDREVVLRHIDPHRAKGILQHDGYAAWWAKHLEPPDAA